MRTLIIVLNIEPFKWRAWRFINVSMPYQDHMMWVNLREVGFELGPLTFVANWEERY